MSSVSKSTRRFSRDSHEELARGDGRWDDAAAGHAARTTGGTTAGMTTAAATSELRGALGALLAETESLSDDSHKGSLDSSLDDGGLGAYDRLLGRRSYEGDSVSKLAPPPAPSPLHHPPTSPLPLRALLPPYMFSDRGLAASESASPASSGPSPTWVQSAPALLRPSPRASVVFSPSPRGSPPASEPASPASFGAASFGAASHGASYQCPIAPRASAHAQPTVPCPAPVVLRPSGPRQDPRQDPRHREPLSPLSPLSPLTPQAVPLAPPSLLSPRSPPSARRFPPPSPRQTPRASPRQTPLPSPRQSAASDGLSWLARSTVASLKDSSAGGSRGRSASVATGQAAARAHAPVSATVSAIAAGGRPTGLQRSTSLGRSLDALQSAPAGPVSPLAGCISGTAGGGASSSSSDVSHRSQLRGPPPMRGMGPPVPAQRQLWEHQHQRKHQHQHRHQPQQANRSVSEPRALPTSTPGAGLVISSPSLGASRWR